MINGLAASVEVTRSTATTASTLSAAAAAVAFAGIGALVVTTLAPDRGDTRSRRTTIFTSAVVLVATAIEIGAYLVEQVSLTAEAVTAVATSTRSLVVAARLLVVGTVLAVLRSQHGEGGDNPAIWRGALVVAAVAAVGTAALDPVGVATWRGVLAVGLGAGGAALARHRHVIRPIPTTVTVGITTVAAVAVVLLGGAGGGWSGQLPTALGTFDVSILPAAPGETNEIHVIGQPGAEGTAPRLLAVTMSGEAVRGPDAGLAPGVPFELFLVSPDHAISYGVELGGSGPWSIELGLRTTRGDLDVPMEVEEP